MKFDYVEDYDDEYKIIDYNGKVYVEGLPRRTVEVVCDLLNKQNEEINRCERLLDLISDCDGVEEIIKKEVQMIDTICEYSCSAWNDYVVLSSFYEDKYERKICF